MKHSPFRSTRLGLVASALAGTLLLGSCGLTEERFTEQAPTLSCKLLRRCDPIDFHRDFADLDACVDATTLGEIDGCRYDDDAARDCRSALKWSCQKVGRNYDEIVDRCSAIWTCDTGNPAPGGSGLLD